MVVAGVAGLGAAGLAVTGFETALITGCVAGVTGGLTATDVEALLTLTLLPALASAVWAALTAAGRPDTDAAAAANEVLSSIIARTSFEVPTNFSRW